MLSLGKHGGRGAPLVLIYDDIQNLLIIFMLLRILLAVRGDLLLDKNSLSQLLALLLDGLFQGTQEI